jgi:hypothetical protein
MQTPASPTCGVQQRTQWRSPPPSLLSSRVSAMCQARAARPAQSVAPHFPGHRGTAAPTWLGCCRLLGTLSGALAQRLEAGGHFRGAGPQWRRCWRHEARALHHAEGQHLGNLQNAAAGRWVRGKSKDKTCLRQERSSRTAKLRAHSHPWSCGMYHVLAQLSQHNLSIKAG